MSGFLLIGIALALALPAVTRGSYARLLELRWRWLSFLGAGLLLQWASGSLPVVRDRFGLAFGALVASYVLILGFGAANLLTRGMAVVTIGIVANFTVILVNTGMPVTVPADWKATGGIRETAKHHERTDADHLVFLSDVLVLRATDEAVSLGDLIVLVGLCDVTYQASRRRRRKRVVLAPDVEIDARDTIDLDATHELDLREFVSATSSASR